MITGNTKVYGLLGRPVRHSLSPQIHNHWFERYGIDAVYVALEIDRLDLGALPLAGANLTVPFKAEVVSQLDWASPLVKRLGAANTVILREGHFHGYNTDTAGFVAAFEASFGATLAGRAAVILGAGGAARAVAAGCAERGATSVCFANRTATRADDAAAQLGIHYPNTRFSGCALTPEAFAERSATTQLVVNCTTGPAAATVCSLSIDNMPADAIWVDINYWMGAPPQLDACRNAGLRVADGVSMLVHQAAEAFQMFAGVAPDVTSVHKLLSSPRRS